MIRTLIHNLAEWDSSACRNLFSRQLIRPLDLAMKALSLLGDGYLYPVLVLLVFAADADKAIALIPCILIAFAISLTTNTLLKNIIRRARPFEVLSGIEHTVNPQDKFSFPSGHTASAFAAATVFAHFLPFSAVPSFGIAFLIGISRIYTGVHYPSDVVAGIVIGMLSASLGLFIPAL